MTLGERLKAVRGNETQKQLAADLEVTTNTYAAYERNERTPGAHFLEAVCRRFQVNPAWLLLGEGQQKQPRVKLQTEQDAPFPPREGDFNFPETAFLLFMMQKAPESFRKLPYDRQELIGTFLWNMFPKVTDQELIIILAIIQVWLDEWRADREEIKSKGD